MCGWCRLIIVSVVPMNSLRFFMFVCVAVSCLTLGCRERPSQSKQESVDLFNRKVKNTERTPRKADPTLTNRIAKAFQESVNPDEKNFGQTALRYGLFLAGIAAVIACIVGWQRWRKRRIEWALNDPMALVQELSFVHQLTEHEKRLMQELSAQHTLSSPLKLFIEPKYLLETWENDFSSPSRPTVRQLLSKLFDITVEEATAVKEGANTEMIYYQA